MPIRALLRTSSLSSGGNPEGRPDSDSFRIAALWVLGITSYLPSTEFLRGLFGVQVKSVRGSALLSSGKERRRVGRSKTFSNGLSASETVIRPVNSVTEKEKLGKEAFCLT